MLRPMLALTASLTFAVFVAGCSKTDTSTTPDATDPANASGDVDPHDVPLTAEEIATLKEETADYTTAVDRIQEYKSTIQTETTGGEPAKAHRALDNLDVVLERLPEAAQESGVPKEKWQEVNETAQNLRDLFNKVHANIDAGKSPDYESVEAEIDSAIDTLAAIQP